jgi:hypothetical protein
MRVLLSIPVALLLTFDEHHFLEAARTSRRDIPRLRSPDVGLISSFSPLPRGQYLMGVQVISILYNQIPIKK